MAFGAAAGAFESDKLRAEQSARSAALMSQEKQQRRALEQRDREFKAQQDANAGLREEEKARYNETIERQDSRDMWARAIDTRNAAREEEKMNGFRLELEAKRKQYDEYDRKDKAQKALSQGNLGFMMDAVLRTGKPLHPAEIARIAKEDPTYASLKGAYTTEDGRFVLDFMGEDKVIKQEIIPQEQQQMIYRSLYGEDFMKQVFNAKKGNYRGSSAEFKALDQVMEENEPGSFLYEQAKERRNYFLGMKPDEGGQETKPLPKLSNKEGTGFSRFFGITDVDDTGRRINKQGHRINKDGSLVQGEQGQGSATPQGQQRGEPTDVQRVFASKSSEGQTYKSQEEMVAEGNVNAATKKKNVKLPTELGFSKLTAGDVYRDVATLQEQESLSDKQKMFLRDGMIWAENNKDEPGDLGYFSRLLLSTNSKTRE